MKENWVSVPSVYKTLRLSTLPRTTSSTTPVNLPAWNPFVKGSLHLAEPSARRGRPGPRKERMGSQGKLLILLLGLLPCFHLYLTLS